MALCGFNFKQSKPKLNFEQKCISVFKNLHIFYFGRYWNEIDYIIDLNQMNRLAHKVNFTSCELQKYGTRPRSDYIDFYEGRMQHKLSFNNALDEFHQLATSNKILETKTSNLSRSELSFITLKTFLGERSKIRNSAQKLVNSLINNVLGGADIHDEIGQQIFENVPTEISEGIEENFQGSFFDSIPAFAQCIGSDTVTVTDQSLLFEPGFVHTRVSHLNFRIHFLKSTIIFNPIWLKQ